MKFGKKYKKLIWFVEALPIILLSIGMMAQPAIIFYNYLQGEKPKQEVAEGGDADGVRKHTARAERAQNADIQGNETDSIDDVDVETNDYDDDLHHTARQRRGFHSPTQQMGYEAGYQAGSNDGTYGNPRYQAYDDSNSYDEQESQTYRLAYENGYNAGYNMNFKD